MTEAEKIEVTDDDHSEAVDFLCRHVSEDWSLDYLVANAIAETKRRIAHTAGDVEPVSALIHALEALDEDTLAYVRLLPEAKQLLAMLYAHPPAQAPTDASLRPAMEAAITKARSEGADDKDISTHWLAYQYLEEQLALPLPKAKAAGEEG